MDLLRTKNLAERISQKLMHELLTSKKKLRAYELQQEKHVRLLRERNKCAEDLVKQTRNKIFRKKSKEFQRPDLKQNISRENSIAASSGYESLNDNASVRSTASSNEFLEYATPILGSFKRRRIIPQATQEKHVAKRAKYQKEYIVKNIKSVESINGEPVAYVEWLNYPPEHNTWESVLNVYDCVLYVDFVTNALELHKKTIDEILEDIKQEKLEISKEKMLKNHSIEEIEKFEPILLQTDLILLAQYRLAASHIKREPSTVRQRVIKYLELKELKKYRIQQLNDLDKWMNRMNMMEQQAPVRIENNVDLECLSFDFNYITESLAGPGVILNEDSPIGCKCVEGCNPLSKCCARLADERFAYDKKSRLRIQPGAAIYECNKSCSCSTDCNNRVIQRGRKNKLCLFKTSNGCGWGVRTDDHINRGEFVSEYVGEVITTKQADERGQLYDAIGRTYLFDLDYNTELDCLYTIDAAMYGNISHFFNHSCSPNLAVFPFFINNLDIYMPRLGFFALRHIKPNEELTFDYIRNDYQNLSTAEKVTCRCGAPNCRKVLF